MGSNPAETNLVKNTLLWIPMLLLTFLSSFYLSWLLFAKVDFLYTAWYDALEIGPLIEKTGPRHRHKPYFHFTDKEEHLRLFGEISRAVHHGGEGLSQISYFDPEGVKIDTLLTSAEITHLNDVARLISLFLSVGAFACTITIVYSILLIYFRISKPPTITLIKGCLATVVAVTVIVMLYGPVKLFYNFHIWVFPSNNQWFFYYEESLMTLMMYAPYLFGYISALLALSALLITALLIWVDHRLYRFFASVEKE